MPILNAKYTLSDTTRTLVVDADNMPQEVHLHNATKSSNQYVYIGNEDMTLTNSLHLDPGESKVLTLRPKDRLFAMSDPTDLDILVLVIQKHD
jgi:hypothetical protein